MVRLQEMLLNLRVVDRFESNSLDFVMFLVDDSNDNGHKLSVMGQGLHGR